MVSLVTLRGNETPRAQRVASLPLTCRGPTPSRRLDRSRPSGQAGPMAGAHRSRSRCARTRRGATWSAGSTASRRRETGACGGRRGAPRPLSRRCHPCPRPLGARRARPHQRLVWRVGQGLLFDARPHGPGVDCALRRDVGRASTQVGRGRRGRVHIRHRPREFPFAAWCRAWGGPAGVLPIGLRRVPGVTVLGREGDAGFTDGAIVHCTEIGGTAVAGLWNAFGEWAAIADAVSHRHPEAWIVGYERGAGLDAALAAGFTAIGPLRVSNRKTHAGPSKLRVPRDCRSPTGGWPRPELPRRLSS